VGFEDAYRLHQGGMSNDIALANSAADPLIEVKFAKRWNLFQWVRKARRRSDEELGNDWDWAIFAIHGDRRSKEGRDVREVMIVDATLGAHMLAYYQDALTNTKL
jgi:hypothetical protein